MSCLLSLLKAYLVHSEGSEVGRHHHFLYLFITVLAITVLPILSQDGTSLDSRPPARASPLLRLGEGGGRGIKSSMVIIIGLVYLGVVK